QVKNNGGGGASGADKAAVQVMGNGDAVHAGRIGNVAFDGIGVRVHDHDVRAVGDVHAAGIGVDQDVIPAFIAGNGNGFDEVVAGRFRLRRGCRRAQEASSTNQKKREQRAN